MKMSVVPTAHASLAASPAHFGEERRKPHVLFPLNVQPNLYPKFSNPLPKQGAFLYSEFKVTYVHFQRFKRQRRAPLR